MTNISLNLKKASPIEVPLYLYQAQMRANKLWDLNFSLIDGKHGWARAQVLGGEFNYSGRSVIVLDPTLKIDEVDVPYKTFIEMFKGLIIKRICKDKGWTITKATNYVASKFIFDEYVYSIMCDIVEEERPKLILKIRDLNHVNCGEFLLGQYNRTIVVILWISSNRNGLRMVKSY